VRAPAFGLKDEEAAGFALPPDLLAQADADDASPGRLGFVMRDDLMQAAAAGSALGERWRINSLLVAPLRNQGRLLGYLILADASSVFTEEAGHLLAAFAGMVATAVDTNTLVLTLRDHAEQLSAALAEIQELDRIKDQLVQNVSHELRLPLMVIQGYADLLKMGALGELGPEPQQAANIISDKSTLLGKRVNDIVMLRGLQQADLKPEPASLADLAHESIEQACPRAASVGVALVGDIAADTTPLFVDRQRIRRAIDELVENAIKFSPGGGEVRVAVREGGDVVYLKVSDRGIGIPASHLDRVWDRFYQSDGSTTRRFGGTGVGLAVVKQIVDAHGGQVWAESRDGGGSHFYFALRRSNGNGAHGGAHGGARNGGV